MTSRALALATLLVLAPEDPPARTGGVAGAVTISSPRGTARLDRSGVVVSLEAVMADDPPVPRPGPPAPHQIRQRDRTFVPAVSAVRVGTEVRFLNDDTTFHSVFSPSPTKPFDLGVNRSGTSPAITPTRPGVIDVHCNVHPEMTAKLVVLDTPHYAVTGPDGAFRIDDVPPGTYTYVAWQARGEPLRGELTVRPGEPGRLDLALVEAPLSTHPSRKDDAPAKHAP